MPRKFREVTRPARDGTCKSTSSRSILAAGYPKKNACRQLFGRHQDRERLLLCGGGLILRHEEALLQPGRRLREQSCLGTRRRFPRRDPFGRLIDPRGRRVCCQGNIFATQGASSHFGSVADHAESMGLDAGHMDYKHLSQAIPPFPTTPRT